MIVNVSPGVDPRSAAGEDGVGRGVGDHPPELGPHLVAEVRRLHGGRGGAVAQDEGVRLLEPEVGVRQHLVGEGRDDDLARQRVVDVVQRALGVQSQRSVYFNCFRY